MDIMCKEPLLDGDLCAHLQVPPPPTLITSQANHFVTFEAGLVKNPARSLRPATSVTAEAAKTHDQHFRIINSDGQPVEGLHYRLQGDGDIVGKTGAMGKTKPAQSNSAMELGFTNDFMAMTMHGIVNHRSTCASI
ncbi:hypothetical protein HR51_34035 [Burkholderia cepacia]|nr:hypothetical protein HR51_34035 [Burkholderia cepacia]